MRRLFKKSVLFLMFAVIAPIFIFSGVYAGDEDNASRPAGLSGTPAEIEASWTAEDMDAAQPYPMPELDASLGQPSTEETAEPVGPPGLVPGTLPESEAELTESWVGEEPQYGGPPGNWSTSYPGPFQRWTWFGRYTTYPTSTIGKLFFKQDHDGNGFWSYFVCSASVIYGGSGQRDVVATAGHCVHNGRGSSQPGVPANGWSFDLLFCPSYNAGGINPSRGCWADVNLVTKWGWVTGNIEYDVACMVAANSGTVWGTHVGDVTGTLGRAWNWGWDEPEFSFGYPAASPFPGYNIVAVAGPEWYTYNWGTSAKDSKYMGNDMTGGCSGGPWILGWGHKSREYADTDGSNATDPLPLGQGWINGVNSHKIIHGGVLRTQEMGSVQFDNSDPNTESLWSACQRIANSD